MERIGGLEVKDRKDTTNTGFKIDAVEFDPLRYAKIPAYTSALAHRS
jgi:hypothetical protein